ncbi:MAG: hypothetical protein D6725_08995 [Planctomycetota bacterium]|nr:MAG: hypothetical protein D6725_08995 [Planctomycetota bacterium]
MSLTLRRLIAALLVAGSLTAASGCALVEPGKEFFRQSWRIFRPKTSDYRDTTQEEVEDGWSFVGKEARGNQPIEHENDPFKRYLMSPKARSIERNLGID